MLSFVQLTPAIQYAVGIDFGHGECSAAKCEIAWGQEGMHLNPPEDIRLYGNNTFTIPSAYAVDSKGRMSIGHDAISSVKDAADFKISFKQRPSEMSPHDAQRYTEYLNKVHTHAIDRACLPIGKYVVYLSCPSGWTVEDRKIFHEMAVQAAIPVAGIWSEARAGLFSNMENQDTNVRELMKEGCVLIDIGSSTVDLSYLNASLSDPLRDSGRNDGAQTLDMMLYYYILSLPGNEVAREMVGRADMQWLKDVLVYECRKSKEALFSAGPEADLFCNFDFAEHFYGDEVYSAAKFRCGRTNGGSRSAIMSLFISGLNSVGLSSEPDMHFKCVDWEAVNSGFFSRLADHLKDFISSYVRGRSVKVILLSGGASFMFLGEAGEKLFRDTVLAPVFGGNDILVAFDGKPSTSVSRGICALGRACAKVHGCEQSSPKLEYESLATRLAKATEFHISLLSQVGSNIIVEKPEKNVIARVRKKISKAPKENPFVRDKAKRFPYGDPAQYYLRAVLKDDDSDMCRAIYNLGLTTLKNVVVSEKTQAYPAAFAREYESFLSDIVSMLPAFRMTVADVIAETVMPLAKKYVDDFSGKNLQQLRDGLAYLLKTNYERISDKAFEEVKKRLREELTLQREYVKSLISLYTASLQKDFVIDQTQLEDGIQLPSVDSLLEQVDIYDNFETISTIILNLMTMIISAVIATLFLGIPFVVSYLVFVIKEKNWSINDWGDWQADILFIDLSTVTIHKPARAALRQAFSSSYGKNMASMKMNIAESLKDTGFDNDVIEAFKTAANGSIQRYIQAVNRIFE